MGSCRDGACQEATSRARPYRARGRVMSRSQRVYRALLLVYPREFRREYGPQMEQAFADLYRQACERGGKRGIGLLWALTISDLARTAVEQRNTPRADHEEVAMYDRRLAVVGSLLLLAPLYFVS